MSGFDLNNLGGLFAGFQKQMAEMKERLAQTRCAGEAGGGIVRIVLTGDSQVDSVTIAPEAMNDRELLEDLVRAAMAEALRNVRSEMEANVRQLTGGLPLPPGMLPF